MPFYSKYGFLPLNHNNKGENEYKKNELQIYKDNEKLFFNEPKMTKNELLSIIFYKKFDKSKDKKILDYINNIVIPRLKEKNNIISVFIKNIIDDTQKNYSIDACELLQHIYIAMYDKCGYYNYIEKTFSLNLKDEKIIKHYKDTIKFKFSK